VEMCVIVSFEEIKKQITVKQCALYYTLHSNNINSKRKNYKRQKWADRADNPKNINKGKKYIEEITKIDMKLNEFGGEK